MPWWGMLPDHEIADGHVVDVLVVRPERGLRVIARPPAGAVEDRAVFADEGIAAFRGDRAGHRMHPGPQTVGRPCRMVVDNVLDWVPGQMSAAPDGQVIVERGP